MRVFAADASAPPDAIYPIGENESEGLLWLRYRECVSSLAEAASAPAALATYTSLQCSNVTRACATLRVHPGDDNLRVLGQRLGERADGLGAHALASALWGLAQLDWEPEPGVLELLVRRAGDVGLQHAGSGNLQIAAQLSRAVWACGMLSFGRPVAVEACRVAMPELCTSPMPMVPYRVYCVIFFCPCSPSFFNRSR